MGTLPATSLTDIRIAFRISATLMFTHGFAHHIPHRTGATLQSPVLVEEPLRRFLAKPQCVCAQDPGPINVIMPRSRNLHLRLFLDLCFHVEICLPLLGTSPTRGGGAGARSLSHLRHANFIVSLQTSCKYFRSNILKKGFII